MLILKKKRMFLLKLYLHKTGVINDPLGQTHCHEPSIEHCFLLICFFLDSKSTYLWTDAQHVRKTMIPTGRDFGLAEWINKNVGFFRCFFPFFHFFSYIVLSHACYFLLILDMINDKKTLFTPLYLFLPTSV